MGFFYETRKNKRQNNQDYYFHIEYKVNHEAAVKAFAVADGMGGLSQGDYIAKRTVELWFTKLQEQLINDTFSNKTIKEQIDNLSKFSLQVFEEINDEIHHLVLDRGIDGGTTLTTVIIFWGLMIIANCGDSPVYLIKNNRIEKITLDQNVAEEMVRDSLTKKGSKVYYQKKNLLTDYIGKNRIPNPCFSTVDFGETDLLLMGSDGAFGALSEQQILKSVLHSKQQSDILTSIMDAAVSAGEDDNQTLILYTDMLEEGENALFSANTLAAKEVQMKKGSKKSVWNKWFGY